MNLHDFEFVAGTRLGQVLKRDLNTADRLTGMQAQLEFYGDCACLDYEEMKKPLARRKKIV